MAALVAVTLVGCRSTKTAAEREKQPAAVEPKTTTVELCETLTANFQCEVEDITISGQVRMRRDSVLWLSANKFIELGRAKFTPDSVFVYAKVMNRYFEGTYADLQKVLGVATDYATLQALFMGENEMVRRSWIVADFSDWRETVEVLEDGSMVKNKRYPYKAEVAVRSKPYTGRTTIIFNKVRMNQPTTYPYSVSALAKKY